MRVHLNDYLIRFFAILTIAALVLPSFAAANQSNLISQLNLEREPFGLNIKLNKKASYKIVQLDKNEVMIAFRYVGISKNIKKNKLSDKFFIKNLKVERLQDGVSAVIITTWNDLKEIKSQWITGTSTLKVRLFEKKVLSKKINNATVKAVEADVLNKRRKEIKKKDNISSLKPKIKTVKNKSDESADYFLNKFISDDCTEQKDIKCALDYYKRGLYQDALLILNRYIENNPDDKYVGKAYFLKAYSFYKKNKKRQTDQCLEAADFFHDALSYAPESRYAFYAMSILGKIYVELKNDAEAEGYFRIVLNKHKDYPGIPEVLLELGKVYKRSKKLKIAISTFKEILSRYPECALAGAAKLEIGKALYESNNFEESLKILTELKESDPYKRYESADLLLTMGNCFYQTGQYKKAREILSTMINCFPGNETNHLALTRIGETYKYENQPEKAKKIFNAVIEKFPETDGFIISSIRIADGLEKDEEKAELYNMVIKNYSDNSMAKVAMLKKANLQIKAGDYEKSINTLKDLLEQRSGTLRTEALYLVQKSFKLLFENLFKENDYPGVLARYEKDKDIIRKTENAELFLMVGKAYAKAYLFRQAAYILKKAYEFYEEDKMLPELLYYLGVSLDESGMYGEAVKMMDAYILNFSKGEHIAEIYTRKGKILMDGKEYGNAIKSLRKAYGLSRITENKATILIDEAGGYKALGNFKQASRCFIKAINLLASAPRDYFVTISMAYFDLGKTWMALKSYGKAADAFAMALKFVEKNKYCPDILFVLGESYQKGNDLDKATRIYEDIVTSGDSFWGGLARGKLSEIRIESKYKKF